jgi:hypothetical protein
MNRFNLLSKSSRIRQVAMRITGHVFDYHHIGVERRAITLLGNGVIGEGARSREAFWSLREKAGEVILEFFSESKITSQLREGKDKVWRGQTIDRKRNPIELSPYHESVGSAISSFSSPSASPSWSESLFLISMPRSLSTLTYHVILRATGLREPLWTSAGEILNVDRFALSPERMSNESRKFLDEELDPTLFAAATEFLNQLVLPVGYAYKDVVQPFVVAEWLKTSRFHAIRIKRSVADIAFSMLNQHWYYPRRLFPEIKKLELALVKGLIRAERTLDSIDAEQIDFDELILDEKPLRVALARFYPNVSIDAVRYIDANFAIMRQNIVKRRSTKKYMQLVKIIAKVSREEDS